MVTAPVLYNRTEKARTVPGLRTCYNAYYFILRRLDTYAIARSVRADSLFDRRELFIDYFADMIFSRDVDALIRVSLDFAEIF